MVASRYGWWGAVTPDDLKAGMKQVGGGECAMMSIARELAKLGHEVIVFYDTKPGRYDGVDYLPRNLYIPMVVQMEHDVLLSWDDTNAFRYADKGKVHVLACQLNDAFIGAFDWTIDMYVHPSQWHADRFHTMYPEMTKSKSIVRLTNGLDYERYAVSDAPKREPHRVIYSSSPDRGLHHLLRMWPQVIAAVPDATLHVFYDMSKWLDLDKRMEETGGFNITHERAKFLRDYIAAGVPNSVTFHGGVGQTELSREQLKSSLMVYPCDPVAPTEGFSMSVLEGVASGCNVIISNADAFPELWTNVPGVTILPLPVDDAVWIDTIVSKLKDPAELTIRYNLELSWAQLARRWEIELRRCLNQK